MPILSGPIGATNLAEALAADLAAGRPGRASYGARDGAFAWAAGLPDLLAAHVSSAVVEGLAFNAIRVKPSGTPAAKVAKGAAKPSAITISSVAVPLSKYAGIATVDTEDTLTGEGLVAALAATMAQSILLAYDTDCIAALTVTGQPTASAAQWPNAILAGIAAVVANGGRPNILVLSPADYASVVSAPGVGYALDPTTAVVTSFGLEIVISPSLATKTAFVLDPAAAMAVENTASPVAIVDPYSGLSTNKVNLAVEAFLGFTATAPGSICKVTYTGT